MAERPVWRGQLRLALVSCPVALFTARRDRSDLHFHLINPTTGHRIRMMTIDAETGEELERGGLVKGYEYAKDRYLLLDDADFEQARIESSGMMRIDKFVEAGGIDPLYYESSYYVAPDGEAGADVYAVLREAIAASGRVALTRVVMARRERAVALMADGRGLIAHTLHDRHDIVDAAPLFEHAPRAKPERDMIALARQLIDRQTGPFDPSDTEDRYATRLRAVIEAKLKGEGVEPEEEAPREDNVIDLMAALKRSLGQTVASSGRTAAKAAVEKSAPKKPSRAALKAAAGRRRAS